jgi:hypothetical protein
MNTDWLEAAFWALVVTLVFAFVVNKDVLFGYGG